MLVTHRYPPDGIGGVERYTESLASELVRREDDVSVLTRTPASSPSEPELRRDRAAAGPRVSRLVGGKVRHDNFLVHHRRLEQLATGALVREDPDVVHVQHLLGLPPRLVETARRLRVPLVLSVHDFYLACALAHLHKRTGEACAGPDGGRECARTCFAHEGEVANARWPLRTQLFHALLAAADLVVCPPGFVADYFERYASPSTRIAVLAPGVERAAEHLPAKDPGGPLRLAVLGTVAPHKGIHLVLEAVAHAGLREVSLAVHGRIDDGAYARGLRERAAVIEGLGLELTGEYAPAELPRLLAGVDAAVFPSLVSEAFPLAPREALAHGVPVVVARSGGLAAAVREEVNGLGFTTGRVDELALALGRLAGSPGLVRELRRGAAGTEILTVAEHVEALRSVYRGACEDVLLRPRGTDDLDELARLRARLLAAGFGSRY